MMATENVTIRMDAELKRQAEELFSDLGLNMTTAITAFARQAVGDVKITQQQFQQAVREQQLPFRLSRIPNAETRAAMAEAERLAADPDARWYEGAEALFKAKGWK